MKDTVKTYTLLSLSMIFWSFSFVWSKIALQTYQPVTIILIRLLISSIILIITLSLIRKLQKLRLQDIKLFILLAFFQPFIYFLGESYGLQQVTPTTASVIISTIPLFSPIAAFYILKEQFTWMNFAGIILSIVGIILVISGKELSFSASPKGIALLFLAVFAAVGYSVVLKKIAVGYNAFSVTAYQNIFGTLFFLPLFFILDWNSFTTANHNNAAISSIVLLAIFGSSLAFIFYTYSVKKIGVTKSIIFCNIIPVFTMIFSFFVVAEEITGKKILGIVVVIAGLLISQLHGLKSNTTAKV